MKFKRPRKTFADKSLSNDPIRKNHPLHYRHKACKKGTQEKPPLNDQDLGITLDVDEWLVGCVIKRDDVWYGETNKFRSHSEVRRLLEDKDPYIEKSGDKAGFITNLGNILTRYQASFIAVACGQAQQQYAGREILSSDILTWA